jgi:glycyl-tRNA synthetase
MAEIEHFVDPMNKKHHKFVNIANECLPLLTAPNQEAAGDMIYDMTMGDAVSSGTIANETIGYFMARTYQFFIKIGIRKDAIRFRQHRCNEMAHYADDCWDAEVETSYGWIEVAGHSDRSCFDLSRHAKETNTEMVAARPLKEPKIVKFIQLTLDKQKIGKTYKKDSKAICAFLDGLEEEQKETYLKDMEDKKSIKFPLNGADFELPSEFVKFEAKEKKVLEEKYIPSVIEPSYGIGRIVYCVFEHCFKMREADA